MRFVFALARREKRPSSSWLPVGYRSAAVVSRFQTAAHPLSETAPFLSCTGLMFLRNVDPFSLGEMENYTVRPS